MTELKKIFDIIKFRFPEVILILGISAISAASFIMSIGREGAAQDSSFIYIFFSTILKIISYVLFIGFLRSVYLNPWQIQSPMSLLKTGLSFFKPILIFSLFMVPFFLVLLSISIILVNGISSTDYTFLELAEESPWLFRLCMTIPLIVLIKPVLLMPALIITEHDKVIQCFRSLQNFKLMKAKTLLFLFFFAIAFGLLSEFFPQKMLVIILLTVVHTFIFSLLNIMIYISAIKFVASEKFGYDSTTNVEISTDQKI